MKYKTPLILVSLIIVCVTPVADWLEQSMLRHVLIQLPLLVFLGYQLGKTRYFNLKIIDQINEKGVAGIILVIFISLYWMLPRALDASLADPAMALAKYLSLPLLIGLPLALSWNKLHPIFRAVVHIELLAMLFRLGWLYLVSPVRLCNAYQLGEQVLLGKYLLFIAVIISVFWCIKLFTANYQEKTQDYLLNR